MNDLSLNSQAELIENINQAWQSLIALLEKLTTQEMTIPTDEHGWTVKDHIGHLGAWERSALAFLQGRPRHQALGIEQTLYWNGTEDEINTVIRQLQRQIPVDQALVELRNTHEELLYLLRNLTSEDLQKPYRHYFPDYPGEGDGPLAFHVVYSNSVHHFAEHLTWIKKLVDAETGGDMSVQ